MYMYMYIYHIYGSRLKISAQKGRLIGWAHRENVLTAREIKTGKIAFLLKNEKRVPGVLWLQWQLDMAGPPHQQAESQVSSLQYSTAAITSS